MLTQDEAQKILDHFYVGKIKQFNYWVYYYQADTNQGTFYILVDNPQTARDTEEERMLKLKKLVGEIKRLLLPDYKGELQNYSSYVHQ